MSETKKLLFQPLFGEITRETKLPQNYSVPDADSDFNKANEFLVHYSDNAPTLNAYRREIERFLQWLWLVAKKSLRQLRRQDIEDYLQFCQNPPLDWIGDKHVPRSNPEWKPFVATISKKMRSFGKTPSCKNYSLSQAGLQAVFAVISSFFTYLIEENYAEINPVMQIRQKSKFFRKFHSKRQIRRLSEIQWQYVIKTTQELAVQYPEKHERSLFIISALYGMYLRVSELAATARWIPQMQHFHKDSEGNWWFTTVGKGNKERDITVSDAMLAALKRYRNYLGLSPLPSPNENIPLIPKINGKGPITETRQIRNIVQTCFDTTNAALRKNQLDAEADELMAATVHWLRHTGISDDVKIRPREHVRDDAGHSSSAITDKYIDVELRARHQSGKNKPLGVKSDC